MRKAKSTTKTNMENYSPRELLHFLISEVVQDSAVQGVSFQMQDGKMPRYDINVHNEQISMILVSNEEEFMSALGFDRKENSNG